MKFKKGDRVVHLGVGGADPTIYQDDEQYKGRAGAIDEPGTGGWDWWVKWDDGDRFMADEVQLRGEAH